MKRDVLAAASPAGWPPPLHGAAARLPRAAALQNTTDSHSETLCIEVGIRRSAFTRLSLHSKSPRVKASPSYRSSATRLPFSPAHNIPAL
jgi:hypothetical protein